MEAETWDASTQPPGFHTQLARVANSCPRSKSSSHPHRQSFGKWMRGLYPVPSAAGV